MIFVIVSGSYYFEDILRNLSWIYLARAWISCRLGRQWFRATYVLISRLLGRQREKNYSEINRSKYSPNLLVLWNIWSSWTTVGLLRMILLTGIRYVSTPSRYVTFNFYCISCCSVIYPCLIELKPVCVPGNITTSNHVLVSFVVIPT
jgi:hypothetical protein